MFAKEIVDKLFALELDKRNLHKSELTYVSAEISVFCWWNLYGYYRYKGLLPRLPLTWKIIHASRPHSERCLLSQVIDFLLIFRDRASLLKDLNLEEESTNAPVDMHQKASVYISLLRNLFGYPDVVPISLYPCLADVFDLVFFKISGLRVKDFMSLRQNSYGSPGNQSQFIAYYLDRNRLRTSRPTGFWSFCDDRRDINIYLPSNLVKGQDLDEIFTNPVYWNFFLKSEVGSSCSEYFPMSIRDTESIRWGTVQAIEKSFKNNSPALSAHENDERMLATIKNLMYGFAGYYAGSTGLFSDGSITDYATALASSIPSNVSLSNVISAIQTCAGFNEKLFLIKVTEAIGVKLKESSHSFLPDQNSEHESGCNANLVPTLNIVHDSSSETGIGQDAECLSRTLSRDFTINMIPLSAFSPWTANPTLVNHRADKSVNIIVSAPADAHAVSRLTRSSLEGPIFLYAPWELEFWPTKHTIISMAYSALLAISKFVQQAFAELPKPVFLVSQTLDFDIIDRVLADRRKFSSINMQKFRFCAALSLDSGFERKNAQCLIEAFKAAFPSTHEVELIIKATSAVGAKQKSLEKLLVMIDNDPRIKIHGNIQPRQEHLHYLASANCFVSFHRSEGFGRNIAESMALGIPVVCTAYGGNMDYCNSSNSILIDYRLIKPFPYYSFSYNNLWAEPDFSCCVEALRLVFANPARCASLSSAGYSSVRDKLSPQLYRQRLLDAIDMYG